MQMSLVRYHIGIFLIGYINKPPPHAGHLLLSVESRVEKSRTLVLCFSSDFIKCTADRESQQTHTWRERQEEKGPAGVFAAEVKVCECGEKRSKGKGS